MPEPSGIARKPALVRQVGRHLICKVSEDEEIRGWTCLSERDHHAVAGWNQRQFSRSINAYHTNPVPSHQHATG